MRKRSKRYMESLKVLHSRIYNIIGNFENYKQLAIMDSPRHYLSCALSSTRSLSVMRVGRSLSARLTDTEGGKWISISFEALSRLVAEANPPMQEAKRLLLTEDERAVFEEDESSPYLQVRKRLQLESGGGGGEALRAHRIGLVSVCH